MSRASITALKSISVPWTRHARVCFIPPNSLPWSCSCFHFLSFFFFFFSLNTFMDNMTKQRKNVKFFTLKQNKTPPPPPPHTHKPEAQLVMMTKLISSWLYSGAIPIFSGVKLDIHDSFLMLLKSYFWLVEILHNPPSYYPFINSIEIMKMTWVIPSVFWNNEGAITETQFLRLCKL